MDVMSVRDVADELSVNERRVRQLIESGDLRAERFGRQWMVLRGDVIDVREAKRVAGHPFSSANAWGILALAEGKDAGWLSASEKRRLSEILSERGIEDLVPRLRGRASRESWFVHPSLLGHLAEDPRTVRAGSSAVDALVSEDSLEVYVPAAFVRDLAAAYHADVAAMEGNVRARIVDGLWPFLPGEEAVGPIVAAVDLLDHAGDERRVRVAREILDGV